MKVKHTQAPWTPFILDMTLAEIPAYIAKCISASSNSDFYFVAGRDERGDVDIAHVGNGPRAAENARLIAAAPDLLEALKELLQTAEYAYRNYPELSGRMKAGEDMRRAKAAIAKAEGVQL